MLGHGAAMFVEAWLLNRPAVIALRPDGELELKRADARHAAARTTSAAAVGPRRFLAFPATGPSGPARWPAPPRRAFGPLAAGRLRQSLPGQGRLFAGKGAVPIGPIGIAAKQRVEAVHQQPGGRIERLARSDRIGGRRAGLAVERSAANPAPVSFGPDRAIAGIAESVAVAVVDASSSVVDRTKFASPPADECSVPLATQLAASRSAPVAVAASNWPPALA